jgi:SAM-dependent methyltransferase
MSNLLKKPWWAMRRRILRWREVAGDRRLGIQSEAARSGVKFDPTSEQSPYEPVQYAALDKIDARVRLGPEDIVYDLGSGSGRIICHYAQKDVSKVIGVEYDQSLAKAALDNINRMKTRLAPVSVIVADAATLSYDDASFVFMYNPFGAETLRKVLARLPAKKDLRVAYVNPLHADVFKEFPQFREADRFSVPYDLGQTQVITWNRD